MGRVRDSSVTRDASFLARSCGGVCVAHQMLRQVAQDMDPAEEVELRRLERHPEACRAVAVLAAARLVADGEPVRDGLRTAQAWPVAGLRDADAGSPPPWPTREVFAPRADAVVRPGSTGPVDGHGVSSRPPLKKTKRMDRRLRATGRLQTTNVKAQRCFPRLSPAHAMFEFKQCALSRTPRPPHPHCGHTHVPPFSPQSPHPSHVQHRPLFRCGDSTVLSAVPLPRPAAHPLASAHASAVAPAASLDPLRPRAPNGQRVARHRCSTARRGSQHPNTVCASICGNPRMQLLTGITC